MKYRHQISCYIEVSVLHQSFPWPPSLQCLFRFSSSQHHPEAATSRRERLSPELFVSLWNMMDVNDFHWSPHALFVCGMLGAGDFSSAHLNTCADGERAADGRPSSPCTASEFTIRATIPPCPLQVTEDPASFWGGNWKLWKQMDNRFFSGLGLFLDLIHHVSFKRSNISAHLFPLQTLNPRLL